MPATEYSVICNTNPDLARLRTEINAHAVLLAAGRSVQGGITFGRYLNGYGVTLTMDDVLDQAGHDALVEAVAAHGGIPEPRVLRIARFLPGGVLPPGQDVTQVDYKVGLVARLHKVIRTRFRGEVREVEYYTDASETELVLSVQVFGDAAMTQLGYARTANGLATERWTRRRWWNTDDSVAAEKVTYKRYSHDPVEQMVEGERRRRNVIRALTMEVLQMLIATTAADPMNPTAGEVAQAEASGAAFIEAYADEVSTYFRTGDVSWRGTPGIGNDNTPWLDNNVIAFGWAGPTIRHEIQAALVEIYAP